MPQVVLRHQYIWSIISKVRKLLGVMTIRSAFVNNIVLSGITHAYLIVIDIGITVIHLGIAAISPVIRFLTEVKSLCNYSE